MALRRPPTRLAAYVAGCALALATMPARSPGDVSSGGAAAPPEASPRLVPLPEAPNEPPQPALTGGAPSPPAVPPAGPRPAQAQPEPAPVAPPPPYPEPPPEQEEPRPEAPPPDDRDVDVELREEELGEPAPPLRPLPTLPPRTPRAAPAARLPVTGFDPLRVGALGAALLVLGAVGTSAAGRRGAPRGS